MRHSKCRFNKLFFSSLLVFLVSLSIAAKDKEAQESGDPDINTREEANEYIDHHIKDSHYFIFFSDHKEGENEYYGFPLPVIIWDDGLHIFSASKFHHGKELVKIDGQHYKLYHSKIYKTDAEGTITYDENDFVANEKPIDFSITKNVVSMFLAGLILLLLFGSLAKSYKKRNIPRRTGRFLEPLVLFVRDEIAEPNIGPKYRKYMGFLLTIFFYILILNLLGMTPLGINVTGNITATFTMAIATFFITQFSGNKHYWKHIFWMPGVPIPFKILLIPIEIIGLFTKPFALMVRLFANMSAGHIVIMSLLSLVVIMRNWFAGPAFFGFALMISVIELLVAFLQAYIFVLLSALYIGMAIEEHYEAEPEEISVV